MTRAAKAPGAALGGILGAVVACAVATPVASATQRLAYVSPAGLPYSALWAVDADGTHRRKLLSGFRVIGAPVWSPDGARIAVPTCRKDVGLCPGGAVWVLDADGHARKRLVASYYNIDQWSPDGTKLLLERGDGALAIVDLHGHFRRVATNAGYGTWSPDGKLILYTRHVLSTANLGVFDVATGDDRRLTSEGTDGQAAWSPDARFVAYVSTPGDDVLALKRTDGSHFHVLAYPGDEEADPRWISPSLVAFKQIDYSGPNGNPGPTSLCTVDIRTRRQRVVVPSGVVDEDWSPLRQQFVFARGRSSSNDALKNIWLVNRDGTGLRRLTSNGNGDQPAWSPDGSAIAVTTLDWDYVWTLILGKGKPRAVGIGYGRDAAWQPGTH